MAAGGGLPRLRGCLTACVHHPMPRFIDFLRCVLAATALAVVTAAQALTALPFDPAAQPPLRSIGVMPVDEPKDCDIYAYTLPEALRAARGGRGRNR